MGYGDDLLITSFAAKIKKKYPDRQIVIGKVSEKQAFHSIVYDNNPNISDCRNLDPNKPIHVIDYHPGNRPYIDYEKSSKNNYVWNKKYKAIPGELFFSNEEELASDKIINQAKIFWESTNNSKFKNIIFLETSSTKLDDKQFSIKHKNKDWGYNNWLSLINKIKNEFLIIQSVHDKTKKIDGVFAPEGIDFRLACALINKSDIYVGPEGGFGHVAAALNKKAVLYFGGWITPEVIGYNLHENIYYENEQSPCGAYRNLCEHCEKARQKITVSFFEKKLRQLLEN